MEKIIFSNYIINDSGQLFSMFCGIKKQMKPATDKKGYIRAGMIIDGKLSTKKMHRLVAEAFILNPENKPQVNHINGIKDDNRAANLEWCTQQENTDHAIKNGLFTSIETQFKENWKPNYGEANGISKLKELEVIEIRRLFKPRIITRKMLAEKFNVSEGIIKDVVTRRTWNHI